MTDGIFESISQGIGREKTQENRRIQEIADELRRRCCVYEKEYGTSCRNRIIINSQIITPNCPAGNEIILTRRGSGVFLFTFCLAETLKEERIRAGLTLGPVVFFVWNCV